KNNYQYTALGASGGVAAIVFAFIYLNPWENLKLFMVVPFPAILFAVAYVVFSYKMKEKDTRVGHEAHLWGAVYGFLFMLATDASHGLSFIEEIKNIPFFN